MTERVDTTVKETKIAINLEKMEKIIQPIGIFLCFIFAFGLAFTQIWPLAFLAAIIGGAFFTEMKKGVIVGMLGLGFG